MLSLCWPCDEITYAREQAKQVAAQVQAQQVAEAQLVALQSDRAASMESIAAARAEVEAVTETAAAKQREADEAAGKRADQIAELRRLNQLSAAEKAAELAKANAARARQAKALELAKKDRTGWPDIQLVIAGADRNRCLQGLSYKIWIFSMLRSKSTIFEVFC